MYNIGDNVVLGVEHKHSFKPMFKGTIVKLWENYAEILTDERKLVKYAFTSIRKSELPNKA